MITTKPTLEEQLQKIESELIECKGQLDEKTDQLDAAEELMLEIYGKMTDKCEICDKEIDPWEGRITNSSPDFFYRNHHLQNEHGFVDTTYAAKHFKLEEESVS